MAIRINRFTIAFCLTVVTGIALGGNLSPSDAVKTGLNAAMFAKLAVSEKFVETGQWPESNAAAGFKESEGTTSVIVGSGGLITITFKDPLELAGKSIVLTPSSADEGLCIGLAKAQICQRIPCQKNVSSPRTVAGEFNHQVRQSTVFK